MKMPLNSSQTIAAVAILIALAAGAYALGRSSQDGAAPVSAVAESKVNAPPVAKLKTTEPVRPAAAPAVARLCNECSRVVGVRSELRKGEGSGLGAVGGAVIGGLLGNQIGGGNGKKIATVGGVVAGGLAGNEIEKHNRSERVWTVQLVNRDGSSQSHQQASDPDVREGDVVVFRDGQLQRR